MAQKTFIMIKPQHVGVAEEILAELDGHATRLKTARVDAVPQSVIEDHYSPHEGKYFFGYMTAMYIDRPVVLAVYEGDDVIQRFIDIIGATDPAKAGPHTIRGRFGTDSLEDAIENGRPVENVIHRSDSEAELERELRVWEKYL